MIIQGIPESIVQYLREQIITGALQPDSRLNEAEIAARLGVSRAPVREAFRLLENGNFIVRVPRRGVYVAELSVEKLEEVYDARIMIERHSIDLLMTKNVRDLPAAEKALEKASKLSLPPLDDKPAMLNYVTVFSEFHLDIIKETGNDWIVQFYDSITYHLARYQFICLYVPGLTSNSLEMHHEILDHIKKGQYESAKTALMTHINHTVTFIKEVIKDKSEAILDELNLKAVGA